eukprot:308614_1
MANDISESGHFTLTFNPNLQINDIIWKHKSAILGRSGSRLSAEIKNFVGIGNSKAISRKHAEISWNERKNCFDLKVLAGSGIFSNSHFYQKNQKISLSMTEPTPLQMGKSRECKLYFLPPIHKSEISNKPFEI